MPERRAETRMLCADMVRLTWRNDSGAQQSCTALLEDISPSGACLQTERAITNGRELSIDHPQAQFSGIVRYCVYRDIGYFVGVQFKPDCGWSRDRFEPQHLLDLERLVLRSARKASGEGS